MTPPEIQLKLNSVAIREPEYKARDFVPCSESLATHAMMRDCTALNAKWRRDKKGGR